jgi:hypothetical protein
MGLASGTNASAHSLRSINAKSNSKHVHSLMNPLREVCNSSSVQSLINQIWEVHQPI